MKYLIVILLLVLPVYALADELPREPAPLSSVRYTTGGMVGGTVGFGIGHAVAREWKHIGWFFTFSQVTAVGLILTSSYLYIHGAGTRHCKFFISVGTILYLASRIWEIADIGIRWDAGH